MLPDRWCVIVVRAAGRDCNHSIGGRAGHSYGVFRSLCKCVEGADHFVTSTSVHCSSVSRADHNVSAPLANAFFISKSSPNQVPRQALRHRHNTGQPQCLRTLGKSFRRQASLAPGSYACSRQCVAPAWSGNAGSSHEHTPASVPHPLIFCWQSYWWCRCAI